MRSVFSSVGLDIRNQTFKHSTSSPSQFQPGDVLDIFLRQIAVAFRGPSIVFQKGQGQERADGEDVRGYEMRHGCGGSRSNNGGDEDREDDGQLEPVALRVKAFLQGQILCRASETIEVAAKSS